MVGVIYKITSPSGKVYVGQTKDYKTRMSGHKKKNSNYIMDSRPSVCPIKIECIFFKGFVFQHELLKNLIKNAA